MRSKSVFLIVACVCGAIAAVGASQFIQGQATAPVNETVEVFVASRVIEAHETIEAGMVTLEAWPRDRVPTGATNDISQLEGKLTSQRVFAGEPMIEGKLLDDSADLASLIPEGFSVVSMKADSGNSVSSLIQPGDRVNVMAYFTKSEQIPETGIRTILRGVKVFAVDGRTTREKPGSKGGVGEAGGRPGFMQGGARDISLLIHKQDEEPWALASELGKIRLSLSRPSDYDETAEDLATGNQFLQWLEDHRQSQQPKVVTAAPVQPRAPVKGFKMLKLHGGQWTEYEFRPGGKTPVVTGRSSAADDDAPGEPSLSEPGSVTDDDDDQQELGDLQAPFFEPE